MAVIAFFSCKKDEGIQSPVPTLEYKGFSKITKPDGKDSIIVLNLTYTDGDGDLGLGSGDTVAPFRYGDAYFSNLFVRFYAIENGVDSQLHSTFFVSDDPIFGDTINFSKRIESLTPEGKSKAISGKIDLLATFFYLDVAGLKPDSAYFTLQLFDRKLNQSKVIKTPVMLLNL